MKLSDVNLINQSLNLHGFVVLGLTQWDKGSQSLLGHGSSQVDESSQGISEGDLSLGWERYLWWPTSVLKVFGEGEFLVQIKLVLLSEIIH